MFPFSHNNNLQSALEYCQQHHRVLGVGQELSPEMLTMVTSTSLFHDAESHTKSMGLSNYGGLAWFTAQFLEKALLQRENGEDITGDIDVLSEKMASVALCLGDSIPSLKLTKPDIDAILNAGEIAMQWLDNTCFPA
ncbi:hypothetical protein [Photobacterium nomapromontoriensis]|uniref:hypothetical protein n=1 Tax=Photobacterium nomapromontoriensis TaxID=2910237 RepID=UPI003D0D2797